jgi:hypothetical protein
MRVEQRDLDALDPAVAAHPAEHSHELVKNLDRPRLPSTDRRPEPDEQRPLGHVAPPQIGDSRTVPDRAGRAQPRGRRACDGSRQRIARV